MDIDTQSESVASSEAIDQSTPDSSQQESQTQESQPEQVSTSSEVPTSEQIAKDAEAKLQAQAPPAYVPNAKFKAYGKEFEFEDWAKGMVKDKETEEKFRSLHAKAYGFEPLKESFEKYKQDVGPKIQEFEQVQRGIDIISQFAKSGDFDNFFASLNIPEQDVYKWLENKVQELSSPEHIQQQMKSAREASRNNLLMKYQHQDLQAQQQQYQNEARDREIEMFTASPEYAPIQSAYEQKAGEGSFKKLVNDRIELGRQKGENLSVEQAMQMVGGTLKTFMGINPQASPTTVQPNQMQAQGVAPQAPSQQASPNRVPGKPPVLPNVSSKSTSPIKASFKNLDEMRKAARALEKGE